MKAAVLFTILFCARNALAADAAYTPLWLYNGKWQVSSKNAAAGAKPDLLLNECALIGRYFACQQTMNGTLSELLIFIPAKEAGHYYTQSVMPEGRAGGRGDLEIAGDKWTFSSTWNQGGKTTYYKTVNVFTGKNHIHFEQLQSPDNKDWKSTNWGDEMRAGTPGRR